LAPGINALLNDLFKKIKINAKIRKGHEILFSKGHSNDWKNLQKDIIINFKDRYTYKSFKQVGNHLLIDTTEGKVDIVFTGEVPKLEFDIFEKDQLILKIKTKL